MLAFYYLPRQISQGCLPASFKFALKKILILVDEFMGRIMSKSKVNMMRVLFTIH